MYCCHTALSSFYPLFSSSFLRPTLENTVFLAILIGLGRIYLAHLYAGKTECGLHGKGAVYLNTKIKTTEVLIEKLPEYRKSLVYEVAAGKKEI